MRRRQPLRMLLLMVLLCSLSGVVEAGVACSNTTSENGTGGSATSLTHVYNGLDERVVVTGLTDIASGMAYERFASVTSATLGNAN